MASSAPKKRSKSIQRNPNPRSNSITSYSFVFLKEPSPDFFPSKEELLRLLGVVVIAVLVATACNYLVKISSFQPKPFCDRNGASEDLLTDFCEPCPANGECFNGNLECLRGYKKHGRSCLEDGEINQTAKKLSELVELCVCEAYVRFSCDTIGTIWVQETEMWKELDEHKLKQKFGLKNDSYLYTKQKAMETIESSLETQTNLHGIKEFKCTDWLAEHYKPFSCYIRQWVSKHALHLILVSTLLVGFITLLILLIRRIHRSQYLSTRAEELYQQVCEILEENVMAAKSVNGKSEPWVVASRLRDHLLLPRERKDRLLWKKVEELVQEDSRLDQYPKLVKGESKVVWEWQVEGSLSSSRKRVKEAASNLRSSGGKHDSHVPQQHTPNAGQLLAYINLFCI